MGTRAHVIICDEDSSLIFYRHSDGYPEETGESLKGFIKMYENGSLRLNPSQSAGWLILHGHIEYSENKELTCRPNPKDNYNGWKVGAYEPTNSLHGDVEYIYIIDLKAGTLSCRVPKSGFWDKPTLANTTACKEFKTVQFKGPKE